jgi:hypothetical protein
MFSRTHFYITCMAVYYVHQSDNRFGSILPQHTTVQTRARSLSVHSQVEPDGFRSQTTRVRQHEVAHASLADRLSVRRRHNLLARFVLYPIT